MIKQYLEIGKIVGTHGIKGMVRVQPWSDSGEFLKNFKRFYLNADGTKYLEPLKIQPHGNVVIISFKNITTIEQAESLRNKIIYINRNDVALPEGRYFINDLIGCTVTDADSKAALGTISDISETGANDIWHITNNGREYLVPAVDEVIVSVDIANNSVVIRPMKGIFDDAD